MLLQHFPLKYETQRNRGIQGRAAKVTRAEVGTGARSRLKSLQATASRARKTVTQSSNFNT
jgi:hypothetical protein